MAEQTCHFPTDSWMLKEDAIALERMTLAETLFSLGNGLIGTRGTFEEGLMDNHSSCEGTYLNGVYLREKIHYEESAHAFATHNNKMVPVVDGKSIRLNINGEPFAPTSHDAVSHTRSLHFKQGVLERITRWKVKEGQHIEIISRRIVSLADQHLMAIEYKVTPVDFDAEIIVESALDASYGRDAVKSENDPRAGHLSITESLTALDQEMNADGLVFLHQVKGTDFVVASACRHSMSHSGTVRQIQEDGRLAEEFQVKLKAGESFVLHKWVSYHHGKNGEEASLKAALKQTIDTAKLAGFESIVQQQEAMLQQFWNKADIVIEGDDALQQGIHFNLYHILQSTGKDSKRAISAKGLSGPGYDGHYFWDTEVYIIPFYVYTNPHIARKLLEYRYSILDASRERARQMSHKIGALYAWRTIGGEECSAYFPAGTAQYHINAAIAYAIRQYVQATDDWEFMCESGAEMLCETARIWSEIGHFSDYKGGKFCINEVTGPDEYSAMVDNNFYTNAMARMHLRAAAMAVETLQKSYPDDYARLVQKIALQDAEVKRWKEAAEKMYLPYDDKLGIHCQDDGFLGKPRWDFENTPKENYPLLLHYHPLVIHRHQVLKQADVVLAMALLGGEFPDDVRKRNLEYYAPLTTHDSTLSTCIYSIESSRAGKKEEAYRLFEETARMDIDNLHHNTEYGLHTACMAGSWMSIVMGFGGMQLRNDVLHFAPSLPAEWNGFAFDVCYKGRSIHVSVDAKQVSYELQEGEAIEIVSYGQSIRLQPKQNVQISYEGKEKVA